MFGNVIKKSFVIVLIMLFGINTISSVNIYKNYYDELDQYQTIRNPENAGISSLNLSVAQSFKPTLNRLTRVELFDEKNGNPSGYILISIRSSLESDDIEWKYLDVDNVLKTPAWYEINFDDDILVEPEKTYFIVWTPQYSEGDDENIVIWCTNWYDNFYTRGEIWNEYPPDNWFIDSPIWDCCFKTYGINIENLPPEPPIINGPNTGKPGYFYSYTFLTVDPNGDKVKYEIDWGDGDVYEWGIICESNELFSKGHTWSYSSNYTLKARAKDIYNKIGNWSTYKITIPINKISFNTFLQRFQQKHLNIFPILQKLLNIV
jgi:hypothetical protein